MHFVTKDGVSQVLCGVFSSTFSGTSFPVIVAWGLMSCQFFFGLGHHATITSLRFEAAFVALHGDITWYNLPIAATLVGLNMLASQVRGCVQFLALQRVSFYM